MKLRDLALLASRDPALDATSTIDATLACSEIARPLVIAGLAERWSNSTLVVATPTGTAAQMIHDDLVHYVGADNALLFPAWETLPFERVSPSVESMGKRLEVLWRLRASDKPRIVVGSVRALLQKLAPGATTREPIIVRRGTDVNADHLMERLIADGYRREDLVEHRGECAQRGSIIDVFPSTTDAPIRIDLWGDEVDRLTTFNVNDQRSADDLDEIVIFPAREVELTNEVRERAQSLLSSEPWGVEQWDRLAEGQQFEGMESWLPWLVERDELLTDVLGADTRLVLVEPRRMHARAVDLLAEEADLARALASTWAREENREFPRLHVEPERLLDTTSSSRSLSLVLPAEAPTAAQVSATGWGPATADAEATAARVRGLVGDGWTVALCAESAGSARRFVEVFNENGVAVVDLARVPNADMTKPGVYVVESALHAGCSLPGARVSVISESDLTGRRRTHRVARAPKRDSSSVFQDLKPGDFVVHHIHGVGKYEGMVTRAIGGSERDYLLLSYKDGDKLYVPTDHIDAVRQYIGGETPTLHRLGGSDFARAKQRVRSAVREIAQELVVLYQKRVNAPGHAFAPDTPWQDEMEAAFPFVETPDQRTAIELVKSDMERTVPMDRLVCGDVGFGKTEVAVRAAFKCIQDGKQVAVLVPTTLLAAQHGNTFAERFRGYPIRVEVLSRFLTTAQAKKVVAGLASGEIDCVIGTHRLLQEKVKFKDLGLLVVDEEQRFGVQHKEAMKKLKTNVDVLTLSATPIPRTLEMSLVGIRDLSLLQTPPADRQPILTYVGEQDDRVAVEAIRRELLRDGQVFWVHNRVQSIEDRAQRLRELVPEARIAIAHGQMDEGRLEQTVIDFWEGNFDVLVCTTIIESGIDMPTVNTLVVERADLLGLGQLHQIRGRVGRSGSRAYAYLFHPRDKTLSQEAYERLKTIGEATDLGSGFKIAMRDLEIRGAGNLLGEAQSGHIAAVGYDLYCQLVTEAVAEMKGEEIPPVIPELKLDVPSDAFLPTDYVPREESRLDAYRRLAGVRSHSDVDDIEREWLDRYGKLPAPAEALLRVGRLRAECHRIGLREVVVENGRAKLGPVTLPASGVMRLSRIDSRAEWNEKLRTLTITMPRTGDAVSALLTFLESMFDSDN
ncbi:MAG: transcription-repair coupling factor [Actinobacteria bacterium]|nr:transcription-repair coupling factor [Actinomycetota bacterium]NCZ92414.1 transcription-repair coupling factor [Actinomycetota bacterium]